MIKAEDILMQALRTPNPLAIKFAFNVPLKTKGNATFQEAQDCSDSLFFRELFELPDVIGVYVFDNQMTLTFQKDFCFEDIEKQVERLVKKNFSDHNPDFESPKSEQSTPERSHLPEDIRQIEEILDRTIRPGLQADGGDLQVISLKDNKLEIAYQGACGGCPSSYMGTLQAIENILRYELGREDLTIYPV